MKVQIPEEVLYIVNVLSKNGYEAFIVGGCIRDAILGLEPKDWDIATDAKPREIKGLFEKTLDTGIKHGTVTVVVNNKGFEVTTYRIDGEYNDSRHPNSVEFTSSLEVDLSRRDFTINAIAYNPYQGYIDPFKGIKDIRDGVIRTVGDPNKRFKEDALRMLRAVRFSSEKNFSIDNKTLESIKRCSFLIKNISQERVRDELNKILVSNYPLRFILLRDTALLQHILPELEVCFHTVQNNPYHVYNVGVHTLYAVASIESDKILRWTVLLHDIGKPLVKTTDSNNIDHFYGHPIKSVKLADVILKRLRFDNKSISRILKLIRYHDMEINVNDKSVRRAVATIGDDVFSDLLKVKEADKRAQNPEFLDKGLGELNQIRRIYNEIKAKGQCVSREYMEVNGNDLIGMGIKPGKRVGRILNELMDMVIEDPSLNKRERLIELVKDKYFKNFNK